MQGLKTFDGSTDMHGCEISQMGDDGVLLTIAGVGEMR